MEYIIGIIAMSIIFVFFVSYKKSITKKRASFNTVGYKLVYSDTRQGRTNENVVYSKLLKSEKYEITGKPDYIYKKIGFNRFLPIELKSGEIKDSINPYDGDLLQLGAYFLIIEEVYGSRPKKGYLIYKDYMFVVKNNHAIRSRVKKTLEKMRIMLLDGKAEANDSFVNCRYCICKDTVCEKRS